MNNQHLSMSNQRPYETLLSRIALIVLLLAGFSSLISIIGTLLGVLCLGVLQNGLNLLAVSTYYQVLFVGIVLIGAAFLERVGASK